MFKIIMSNEINDLLTTKFASRQSIKRDKDNGFIRF